MATGLLGGLDPQQYGLLSAGLSLLSNSRGPNAQNAFGLAGQAGLQGLLQGQDYQDRQAYQQERAGLLGAQRQKIEQEQAQRAQQRAYLDSLRPGAAASDALASGGGPTNANAAGIGQPRQFDAYQAMLAGIPPEMAKSLAEAGNYGKSEVGNFQTVRGPDGQPTVVGYDKFGGVMQTGQTPYEKAGVQNLGGRTVGYDPLTGTERFSMLNSQSPDSVASNALGWANNGVARGNLGVAQGNLSVAQQRFALDRDAPKGQYDPTRGVMVDTRTGIASPVFGSDGQPLGAKAEKPTEFQGKSAIFGARAAESDRVLNELQSKGVTDPGVLKSIIGSTPLIGNGLGAAMNVVPPSLGGPSAQQQQVEQARRDFVNAVLRQESGAAIGESEFQNASRQYFPQPGDSAAVIEQKARNRALTVQGLQANGGPANVRIPTPARPGSSGAWDAGGTQPAVPADIGSLLNKYGVK